MKKFPLLLGLLLTLSGMHAQFVAEYASDGHNMRYTAIAKRNGNYIAAGTESKNIVISEIRPNGVLIRSTYLYVGDAVVEQPVKSLIVDSDGFIVIAGYRDAVNLSASEAYVLKYDWVMDTVVWSQVFDDAGTNFFKILEKSPGGNYLVSGMVRTVGLEIHSVLIEVDRNLGSWSFLDVSSHDPFNDTYYAMGKSGSNIYLAGRQQFSGGSADKMRNTVTKLDNTGNVLFNYAYLRDTADYARLYGADIIVQAKKFITLACGGGNTLSTARDLYAVCAGINGKVKWSNYYDITSTTLDGMWLSIKPYGSNYLIAGSMYNPNDPLGYGQGGKMFVLYVDTYGQIIWANTYEIYSDHYYYLGHTDMLIVDGDHFVLAGNVRNPVTNKFHAVVLKAPVIDGVLPDGCSEPLDVNVIPDNIFRQYANLYDAAETFGAVTVDAPNLDADAYNYETYCVPPELTDAEYTRTASAGNMQIIAPVHQQVTYLLPVEKQQSATVAIYTLQGACVQMQSVEVDQVNAISIDDLPTGTYILVVQLADGSKRWNETFVVM